MTYNLLKKGGIPALACVPSASGDGSFLQCTFQVKYDNERLYATFSLQYNTPVHDIEDTQPFNLIYDADNLLPNTTKYQIPTRTLSPRDEVYIARNGLPEIRVLSLLLQKPCPIICPTVPSSIVAKASCQTPSRCLVDLAKSKHIEIVFDWKWLHPKRIESFLSIVSQPERFCGFPIDEKNLKGRRLEDWTIFSPEEENVVVSKEPPPYTEAVLKRPRQPSSSPSPSAKRVFAIPPGSPTERATTASSPNSLKHMSSVIDKSHPTASLHTVSAHPGFHPEKSNLPNTETNTSDPYALENHVRSIMFDFFPAMFASFIDRSVSPSSSSSIDPKTYPTKTPSTKSIRQIRSLLTKHAARHAEKRLGTICEEMQYDANLLRQAADDEFLAVVAEEKWDMTQRKEDALEELGVEIDKVVEEKLFELSDEIDRLVEQAGVKVENAIDTKVECYLHSTTWNKAITDNLLDRDAPPGNTTTRKAHAAGDRKRRSFIFRSCGR